MDGGKGGKGVKGGGRREEGGGWREGGNTIRGEGKVNRSLKESHRNVICVGRQIIHPCHSEVYTGGGGGGGGGGGNSSDRHSIKQLFPFPSPHHQVDPQLTLPTPPGEPPTHYSHTHTTLIYSSISYV